MSQGPIITSLLRENETSTLCYRYVTILCYPGNQNDAIQSLYAEEVNLLPCGNMSDPDNRHLI